MGEIAVAIADDNERILDLLGEMIENNKEMKLVGKANNGEDVYTLIKEKQPDVVLLDLIMPKMDGLSVMDTVNRDHDYHCSGTGADYRRCISQRCFLLYSETVQ